MTKVTKRAKRPAPARQPAGLNPQQRRAVEHGSGPLLIIAGAGTGKTMTLAHRVAHLIEKGVPAERILLLTFTRRAAVEMLHRVDVIRHTGRRDLAAGKVWGGTFHAVGTRLLRIYGQAIGVDPRFTIFDASDSEDLLDVLRSELKLAEKRKDFPKKGACQTLHSGWINSGKKLDTFLKDSFPWQTGYLDGLQRLFAAYEERKRRQNVFDFDDLLLYWHKLLADPGAGEAIRNRFDSVLVDEYQDTNPIQARILKLLRPDGTGLTVVGDDAQSIYSFRGATVRNILDYPKQFPGTTVVKLEENYRSTEPILAATNQVIAQAAEAFRKELRSSRLEGEMPRLVGCADDHAEASFVVDQIARHKKAGTPLHQQAILFRASHHSLAIELELTRKRIPFHKYGGLKFAEAAHVKDLVAFLRLAENSLDMVSGLRLLKFLPGIGPKKAQAIMDGFVAAGGNLDHLRQCKLPPSAGKAWTEFTSLLAELVKTPEKPVTTQIRQVLKFYTPFLRETYDNAEQRLDDLKKLLELAGRHEDRSSFLAELTLDPPSSTRDLAKSLPQDKDFLVLSTIHSAKGLEWDTVFVINATEGAIPSSRASDTVEKLDEELRLFYVALTRAKNRLYVTYPRYRSSFQSSWSYGYGMDLPELTRFLPNKVRRCFEEEGSWSEAGSRRRR
jgi:DNA helicase-2/ATP-dependent DNA helicase PcrA